MKLTLLCEYEFKKNDIYILESIDNKIIINNNYSGIFLTNYKLKNYHQIDFNKYSGIYILYSASNGNEILIYSADENYLFLVNIINEKISYIELANFKELLSNFYYWDENICILTGYNCDFYIIDFQKLQIKAIDEKKVTNNNPLFYNFYYEIKKHYSKFQVNGTEYNFIYHDESKNNIIFYDYLNNNKNWVKNSTCDYHDLIYKDGIFVFISEDKIEMKVNNISIDLYPDDGYIFLRARFVNEKEKIFLIILCGYEPNFRMSKLISYQVLI